MATEIASRHPEATTRRAGGVPAPVERRAPYGRSSAVATAIALVGWVVLVAVGRWWGQALLARGRRLELPEPPLLGRPGPGWTIRLLAPVVVGLVLVWVLPWAAARLRWTAAVAVAVVGWLAWAVGLAAVDGPGWTSGLTRGLAGGNELGADVGRVAADPGRFLATFSRHIRDYHVQVRGHPPGMVLLLAGLRDLGLGGDGWAAAVLVLAGATSVAVVLAVARRVAGEGAARRALPFVVLSPAAIWMVTSTDAFFVLASAVAVALTLVALRPGGATDLGRSDEQAAGRRGRASAVRRGDELAAWRPRRVVDVRRGDGVAVLAGLAWAGCLLLSYGLVLVALIPVVVAWRERRWRPLVVASVVGMAALVAFGLTGFWWPAGLLATRHQYATLGVSRPQWYFGVADLSAWALALGPALAVALVRLRGWPAWHRGGEVGADGRARRTRSGGGLALLVAGGVLAALVADVSGMSEGEVGRIWLPFTAWVLLAGVSLAGAGWNRARAWLALQAISAVVLVALVTTQW